MCPKRAYTRLLDIWFQKSFNFDSVRISSDSVFRVQRDRWTRKSGTGRCSGWEIEKIGIGRWFLDIYPTLVPTELCRNLFAGTGSFGKRFWWTLLSWYRKNLGKYEIWKKNLKRKKIYFKQKSLNIFIYTHSIQRYKMVPVFSTVRTNFRPGVLNTIWLY